MKKLILFGLLFIAHINFAQNNFDPTGNVGLGVANPQVKLDVLGAGRFNVPDDKSGIGGLTVETPSGPNLKIGGNFTYSWIQSHMSLPLYINELGNNTIFNLAGGNVGVGTANPLAKLEIRGGNILVRNSANVDNESSIMIAHSINITSYDTFGTSVRTITQSAGNNTYGMQFFTQESYLTGQTEKLRIQGNGNVGIGTINPDAKLAVNGTIHSKEVKVDMTGWSDFVFKKGYNLPTLEQVEKHIFKNGHLENIPSEKEVLENGINLGEMNAKLLQKIEELTLYMIEMKKENEIVKNENNLMKKNQVELEKRIKNIEKK